MKCDICSTVEEIPFKCRYCNQIFCHTHRLPLNHDCPFMQEYLDQPKKAKIFLGKLKGESGSARERIPAMIRNTITLRFSKIEIAHLLLGMGLVTAVGMSLYNYRVTWEFLAIFTSAFLIHEFGHKFLAQMYHAWAEFRVEFYGVVVTAISALPVMPFKFIAPGAVFISGLANEGKYGRVALIGPLINIVMGAGFLAAYYIIPNPSGYLLTGVTFNGWIAMFNLFPFGGLDGQKVFGWSKVVWGITMAGAILLFIGGRLVSGGNFLNFFGI